MTLYDILVKSASAGIALMRGDGSMPPGCNGPYDDTETPVRNTAHWLITFAKAYDISGESRFSDVVERCASYLVGENARPMGETFLCRSNPKKDFCNGLIGQAWVFEALRIATDTLVDNRFIELAREVQSLHPFSHKLGLWRTVNVDGSYGSIDMTFNHQLWFAACSSLISENESETKKQIVSFMDKLDAVMKLRGNGRIAHPIPESAVKNRFVGGLKNFHRRFKTTREQLNFESEREIGYHQFNLYAFAILKEKLPDNKFWESHKLQSILRYIETDEYAIGIETSRFGYPYNPPGFECAYAILLFHDHFDEPDSLVIKWVTRQIIRCYDMESCFMFLNSADRMTSAARIYEATRLPDIELEI